MEVICDVCGSIVVRTEKWVQDRARKNHLKIVCSPNCTAKLRCTQVTVPCGQCGQPVTRTQKIQKESKSGHLFCNHSCAIIYNNAHKTWGTRRSKLEVWLEEQLRATYPNLDIHCNRRDAINAELDIYFPSLKLAFELNGIFHYEPIYGGQEGLTKTQTRDAQKFLACHERGIELCIIDTSKQTYFTTKGAQRFLTLIRGVLDGVIAQRLSGGWNIQSTDPLRGKDRLPVMQKPKPLPFKATRALEKAMIWESEIQSGSITKSGIARREGIVPSYVTYLMCLLELPDKVKTCLVERDPTYGNMTLLGAVNLVKSQRSCG